MCVREREMSEGVTRVGEDQCGAEAMAGAVADVEAVLVPVILMARMASSSAAVEAGSGDGGRWWRRPSGLHWH